MAKLFSVETARHLVLWISATLALAALMAIIAPLLLDGRWTWAGVISAAPNTVGITFILMLASAIYDGSARFRTGNAGMWSWFFAGAALLAGIAFLIELPLARFLMPWIAYRKLPSAIFVGSAGALACSVAYFYHRRGKMLFAAKRSEVKAELFSFGIFIGTFLALFVVHLLWLRGIENFSQLLERDASVSLTATVFYILVPLLLIGALVGYCISAALSGMGSAHSVLNAEIPGAIPSLDYQWIDYAPSRPFRTNREEYVRRSVPVVMIYVLAGLVVGYLIWPQQWFGSAVGCAFLGLVASFGHLAMTHRSFRKMDAESPDTSLVGRRAFVRENGGRLEFVVMRDGDKPSGDVQLEIPWDDVLEFSKDGYNAVFGVTHAPPFKTDWNVVKLVPVNAGPLLVSETLAGAADVYEIVSQLTNRFGESARKEFLQARSNPRQRVSSDVPAEL